MNANQRECPGPRRCEVCDDGHCLGEELGAHHLEVFLWRASDTHPQSPQCSAVTVLRPLLVQPATVEAQMIMEPFRLGIERMVKERRGRGGDASEALGVLTQLRENESEDECPRIVVRAITL